MINWNPTLTAQVGFGIHCDSPSAGSLMGVGRAPVDAQRLLHGTVYVVRQLVGVPWRGKMALEGIEKWQLPMRKSAWSSQLTCHWYVECQFLDAASEVKEQNLFPMGQPGASQASDACARRKW